jgi:hypothetical protein
VNFEDWWKKQTSLMALDAGDRFISEGAWQAAQKAERERTTAIMLKYIHDDNYAQWNEAIKTAMRAINE